MSLEGVPRCLSDKESPAKQKPWVRSLGWKDLLEKEMVTYSRTLAWRIPGTEEPGGLRSVGSQSDRSKQKQYIWKQRAKEQ